MTDETPFPIDRLRPRPGYLWMEPGPGGELFPTIEIPLEPFELLGEQEDPSIRLDFIDLPSVEPAEVAGRTFDFPVNPDDGYIDGSVYLGLGHNYFDVTRITFGSVVDGGVRARLTATLDTSLIGGGVFGPSVPVELDAVLQARKP